LNVTVTTNSISNTGLEESQSDSVSADRSGEPSLTVPQNKAIIIKPSKSRVVIYDEALDWAKLQAQKKGVSLRSESSTVTTTTKLKKLNLLFVVAGNDWTEKGNVAHQFSGEEVQRIVSNLRNFGRQVVQNFPVTIQIALVLVVSPLFLPAYANGVEDTAHLISSNCDLLRTAIVLDDSESNSISSSELAEDSEESRLLLLKTSSTSTVTFSTTGSESAVLVDELPELRPEHLTPDKFHFLPDFGPVLEAKVREWAEKVFG